ncbi:MAG: large conductance mechanosensitive channel protein MscL [Bacteroidetes bacterium]|nr:large conductance mechanosensitive channel protein MscL [Bacteroidota bacterium]MBS1633912.1 large conductance mechanosensitive channel protein MscL [Bacteroidota bacterium]
MGMLKEFKEFATKGNVMDLAVAVIMGAAFGAIITALTDKILMPIIGSFIGKSFESLSADVNGVTIQYGAFIQAVINFLLIAFFLFILIKAINSMKKKEEAPPPAGPSSTDKLLMEIRDALKK